jgi:hypothetical protein
VVRLRLLWLVAEREPARLGREAVPQRRVQTHGVAGLIPLIHRQRDVPSGYTRTIINQPGSATAAC